MPDYPINHGGAEIGGGKSFMTAARSGRLWPWDWTPEHSWECRIDYSDLAGTAGTQSTTITIPSTDFVSGRLSLSFSGGGLVGTITVTADAAVGETEDQLGDTTVTAITAAIGGSLAGVAASVSNSISNEVVIVFEEGIGLVTVTATYAPAQQTSITWGGTLVDGEYSVRFLTESVDVTVDNDRVAASPVDAAAMAVAFEAAAEALIGSTLAGVLVSADDAAGVNTLIFEPGVECTVTASVTSNTTHTFGGTATDGDYVTRFAHSSLPGGLLDITTTRSGGAPATNTDLADAFEADVEARALLSLLLQSADNTAGANVLTFFPGVTGMEVTAVSAPAPGTLTVSDPTVVVADETPAGPAITVSHSVTINLNSLADRGRFPHHVMRHEVALEVDTAFGAGRTITVGNGDGADVLLGATPVTLNSTGRSLADAACTQYRTRYAGTMVPTATIVLGSSLALTVGSAYVQINYSPHPSMTASAA